MRMNTLTGTDEEKARPSVWPVYLAAVIGTHTIWGLVSEYATHEHELGQWHVTQGRGGLRSCLSRLKLAVLRSLTVP